MRYLFISTYTPHDVELDRRRQACIIDKPAGEITEMLAAAFSTLEIRPIDRAISEYLDQSKEDDTSDGYAWEVEADNGEYHFEWEPFEPADPVTKEAILAWANKKVADELQQPLPPLSKGGGGVGWDRQVTRKITRKASTHEELVNVMGRWYWRSIDEWGAFELKEQLHLQAIEGCEGKPYKRMTTDELLDAIMEEIVPAMRDNYDELDARKPFGMSVMLEDRSLWYDER